MDISAEIRRRAFSAWLRTGRIPKWLKAVPAEFKFNPWHDPDDGRFTFAGAGRYFGRGNGATARRDIAAHSDQRKPRGFRGGGGDFGGGGASGSWGDDHGGRSRAESRESRGGSADRRRAGGGLFNRGESGGGGASGGLDPPTPETKPQPKRDGQTAAPRRAAPQTHVEPGISPRIARRAAEENWQRVERNGYTYLIDRLGRTRHVSGTLTLNDARRSRSAQARAGAPDRRPKDDGGHFVARRFNGPSEAFNHFAQDANFNRGSYRALEDEWARALRAGKHVEVKIEPVYSGASQRPSRINVWFWIDGERRSLRFPNEAQENGSVKR